MLFHFKIKTDDECNEILIKLEYITIRLLYYNVILWIRLSIYQSSICGNQLFVLLTRSLSKEQFQVPLE